MDSKTSSLPLSSRCSLRNSFQKPKDLILGEKMDLPLEKVSCRWSETEGSDSDSQVGSSPFDRLSLSSDDWYEDYYHQKTPPTPPTNATPLPSQTNHNAVARCNYCRTKLCQWGSRRELEYFTVMNVWGVKDMYCSEDEYFKTRMEQQSAGTTSSYEFKQAKHRQDTHNARSSRERVRDESRS